MDAERAPFGLDEETAEEYAIVLQRFVGVTFRAALGIYPLLLTLNSVFLARSITPVQIGVGAAALALPVAVEFVSSDRDVDTLEGFVAGVLVLWLVATVAVPVAGSFGAPVETAQRIGLALLLVGYVLAYLLSYGGWWARLRGGDADAPSED